MSGSPANMSPRPVTDPDGCRAGGLAATPAGPGTRRTGPPDRASRSSDPCGSAALGVSAARFHRGKLMASTFETVAGIIAETSDIEREKITPDSHAINDLGIDSLDFLDVAFAIDKAFGIKMPL